MKTNVFCTACLLLLTGLCFGKVKLVPSHCGSEKAPDKMQDVLPCYLSTKEPDYGWVLKETRQEELKLGDIKHSITVFSLELTSLRWTQGERDKVSHPVWKHRLTVYKPDKVQSRTSLLYVNNGTLYPSEKNPYIAPHDDLEFSRIAARTHSIVVDLKDVPNQYLTFSDSAPLSEDRLIAYTWSRFMANPDKNFDWPLRLPMVKSVKSAMDASQEFLFEKKVPIDRFVLSGGSKRGWTIWLVAALEERVAAIEPLVADFLNLPEIIRHLFSVYKQGNPAIAPYLPLRPLVGSDPMNKLIATVDPYQYRNLLTLPKYIVSASGDNFVPTDTSRFFYPDLPGQKWMRVLPNRSHYIVREDRKQVSDLVESFYGAFIGNRPIPELKWHVVGNKLQLESSKPPKSSRLWTATNPEARDFRKAEDNPKVSAFSSSELAFKCGKVCTLEVALPVPKSGWSASFVEVVYNNAPYEDLILTTRVYVVPDRYPEQISP